MGGLRETRLEPQEVLILMHPILYARPGIDKGFVGNSYERLAGLILIHYE